MQHTPFCLQYKPDLQWVNQLINQKNFLFPVMCLLAPESINQTFSYGYNVWQTRTTSSSCVLQCADSRTSSSNSSSSWVATCPLYFFSWGCHLDFYESPRVDVLSYLELQCVWPYYAQFTISCVFLVQMWLHRFSFWDFTSFVSYVVTFVYASLIIPCEDSNSSFTSRSMLCPQILHAMSKWILPALENSPVWKKSPPSLWWSMWWWMS